MLHTTIKSTIVCLSVLLVNLSVYAADEDIPALVGAASEGGSPGSPAPAVPPTPPTPPAPRVDSLLPDTLSCSQSAEKWDREIGAPAKARRVKAVVIVFNQSGQVCYRSSPRITQGDLIYVGVYGDESEVQQLDMTIPACSLETTDLRIIDTTAGLKLQAGKPILRKFQPRECFDPEIEIQIRQHNTQALLWKQTLKQYSRFHGTFQIGALWTSLHKASYSTVDLGAGSVIKSDIDDSDGPLYVASLVVYGAPHYLATAFGNSRYPGRDIINENGFLDRIGLALSFGLEKPKDIFGIGLTYELATGINISATQLYRRLEVLDGVSAGDSFSGSSIPTKKSWKDEFVWGISIDARYLAKFFGSTTK